MKKTMISLLTLIVLFSHGGLSAHEECLSCFPSDDSSLLELHKEKVHLYQSHSELKHYVNLDQVETLDNLFVVHVNNELVYTDAIFSDQNGFFIVEKKWPWTPFVCSSCGAVNSATSLYCGSCGAPRSD